MPLAQLYRRAINATNAQERHNRAYYLAEATLKLAASLRIGIVLEKCLEPRSLFARSLEKLCLASVGHWAGFLRESSDYLESRRDRALLPLANTHAELLEHRALPAVKTFSELGAKTDAGQEPPLAGELVRGAVRQGIMGFFNLLPTYRNAVFGHGTQLPDTFYREMGPPLLDAVSEVLAQRCLFGRLILALGRVVAAPSDHSCEIDWLGLRGLEALRLPSAELGSEIAPLEAAGKVYFVGAGVRVKLHPLVIYREDKWERRQIGFLNRTVTRRRRTEGSEEFEEVCSCEYLDYSVGPISWVEARPELTKLLCRLRGQEVRISEVDRLIHEEPAEPHEEQEAERLRTGTTIGDFELEGELGRGGMAVVFLAWQRSLHRRVALKVLPPDMAGDPVTLARFEREIAALARCDHPNLVKILTSDTDRDLHYYAMEMVEGTNFADLFEVLRTWRKESGQPLSEGDLSAAVETSTARARRRKGQSSPADNQGKEQAPPSSAQMGMAGATQGAVLPDLERIEPRPPEVVKGRALYYRLGELFADAADALAHLHERGIIHRDIKPANLMITADGRRVVLMDLGLAQLRDRSKSLTLTGTRWVGTLRYCAPEQLTRNLLAIDERADIYGLGAALYELTRLAPLFDGNSEERLIHQVLREEPPDPHKLDRSVPRDLAAIVMHCIDKDRTHRYGSARDLVEDLRRFCVGEPVGVRPVGTPERLWRWCRRNPLIAALIGAVASLTVAVAIVSTISAIHLRKTVALADFDLSSLYLDRAKPDWPLALAHLARGLRADPENALLRQSSVLVLITNQWYFPRTPALRHGDGVAAASFTKDGKYIVTASWDRTARIWNAQTGEPVGQPLLHAEAVAAASFSEDGKYVVTASWDKTARVWDARSGEPILYNDKPILLQHGDKVVAASFSPDGKFIVTASWDYTARIWDAQTGKQIGQPLQHSNEVKAASFSRDGKFIVTASLDKTARIWDAQTGKQIGRPLQHTDEVQAASFSPDGKFIVTASLDKTARIWDAQTGEPTRHVLQHDAPVAAASFSRDGTRIVTASWDRTAKIWDARTGEQIGEPLRHDAGVLAASFNRDRTRIVTASWDHTARVWDAQTGKAVGQPIHHDAEVAAASFSEDGSRIVTGSWDHTARIWDGRTGEPIGQALHHDFLLNAASFNANGTRMVAGSSDCTARIWDALTGKPIGQPLLHDADVVAANFSPDGNRIVTASLDHTARIWDAQTGEPIGHVLHHGAAVRAASYSPDGKYIVTASWDCTARIWDGETGEPIGQPLVHDDQVQAASFSSDGKYIVTASWDRTACIWDAQTCTQIGQPLQHVSVVWAASFNQQGTRIVTASWDHKARIWDAKSGKPILYKGEPILLKHGAGVAAASFNREGNRIVTASWDGTARIWDAQTGKPIGQPLLHDADVVAANFSPDGNRIVTGSWDGTARIWDAQTGKPIGQPLHHAREVVTASFSPDGSHIVTASWDGTARIWDVAGVFEASRRVWLPDLLEALGGKRLNEDEALVDAEKDLFEIRNRILDSKDDAFWSRLGHRLITTEPEATMDPNSTVTPWE